MKKGFENLVETCFGIAKAELYASNLEKARRHYAARVSRRLIAIYTDQEIRALVALLQLDRAASVERLKKLTRLCSFDRFCQTLLEYRAQIR